MKNKLSVLRIMEGKYIQFMEAQGVGPEKFYMNQDTLFILYNEVMMEKTGIELDFEGAKRGELYYREVNVSVVESLFLGEIIAL